MIGRIGRFNSKEDRKIGFIILAEKRGKSLNYKIIRRVHVCEEA